MVLEIKSAQIYAYEYIRERMLDGTYKGGMKLTEERLAEEIGVSRTPIREAIRRLEQEGLIKNKKIYKPTEEDLINLYEMRILIESYAARKAAKNMSSETISELKQIIKQSRQEKAGNIYAVNQRFHDIITGECHNPVMIDILGKVRTTFHLFTLQADAYKRPLLVDEHEGIYRAIKERNEELAGELMAKHLERDKNFTLIALKKKRP